MNIDNNQVGREKSFDRVYSRGLEKNIEKYFDDRRFLKVIENRV